jgi:hypothetical protein
MFEKYNMGYNELMMLLAYLEPDKLKLEIEGGKIVDIERKDFISIFEKKHIE